MSRLLRNFLVLLGILGVLGVAGLQTPAPVYASDSTEAAKKSSCEGIGGTYADGECQTDSADIDEVVANVINILSIIVGVVAVIMIMVGGFKYVTAGGDSAKLGSAKSTILYAVVGLVIVALAQIIVKFVVKTSTGIPDAPA